MKFSEKMDHDQQLDTIFFYRGFVSVSNISPMLGIWIFRKVKHDKRNNSYFYMDRDGLYFCLWGWGAPVISMWTDGDIWSMCAVSFEQVLQKWYFTLLIMVNGVNHWCHSYHFISFLKSLLTKSRFGKYQNIVICLYSASKSRFQSFMSRIVQ